MIRLVIVLLTIFDRMHQEAVGYRAKSSGLDLTPIETVQLVIAQ